MCKKQWVRGAFASIVSTAGALLRTLIQRSDCIITPQHRPKVGETRHATHLEAGCGSGQ